MLEGIDRWQRRHAAAAVPVAVVRKFLDDRASSLAALIAYYAFFSLFPLLLVLVSVLGFVLQDDPTLRDDVLDSALARIPVVGAQLEDDIEPLTGSEAALAIGLAGALPSPCCGRETRGAPPLPRLPEGPSASGRFRPSRRGTRDRKSVV